MIVSADFGGKDCISLLWACKVVLGKGSAKSGLPHDRHFLGAGLISNMQPAEVDAAGEPVAVEGDAVAPGLPPTVFQNRDLAPEHVVHGDLVALPR